MIDFHCHILPSLDDGAVTVDDSIAMARALADFGYTSVCCTPHCIKGYYDLTPEKVREATLMLQADLDNAEIDLELRPGMEYMLDECFADFAKDLLPLGDTRLVLCEAPPQAHPQVVRENLELIIQKGFVPLVAHPERTLHFYEMLRSRDAETLRGKNQATETQDLFGQEMPASRSHETTASHGPRPAFRNFLAKFLPFTSRVPRPASRPFKESVSRVPRPALPEICVFHANLGSFTGFYGSDVQARAYALLKAGVFTGLATDLHDSGSASKVLKKEKFETNPLLQKLAEWDGKVDIEALQKAQGTDGGGQEELF